MEEETERLRRRLARLERELAVVRLKQRDLKCEKARLTTERKNVLKDLRRRVRLNTGDG